MKRIFILLTATLPWMTRAASPDPWLDAAGRRDYPNLLHNRSFEAHPHQKRVDSATIWNPKSGATRDFASAARTGKSSLKFTGKGEAGHPLALLPDLLTKPKFDLLDAYRSETQVAATRRSNVHLLSDGAEIRGSAPIIFSVMSMGKTDHGHLQKPNTNWLVRGLTFERRGSQSAIDMSMTETLIAGNTVEGVSVFSLAHHSALDEDPQHRGHLFENNTGSITEAVLKLEELEPEEIIEGFHYRNNAFTGPATSAAVPPETARHLQNTTGLNGVK